MQGCPRGTCRHRSQPPTHSGEGLSNGAEVEEGEHGGDAHVAAAADTGIHRQQQFGAGALLEFRRWMGMEKITLALSQEQRKSCRKTGK